MEQTFAQTSAAMPAPQRRSARARREQRARAEARTISRLVHASVILAGHRGCRPGQYLSHLANLLVGPAAPVEAMPCVDLQIGNPAGPRLPGVPVARITKPRPMAVAKPPARAIRGYTFTDDEGAEMHTEHDSQDVSSSGGVPAHEAFEPLAVASMPLRSVSQLAQYFELAGQGRPTETFTNDVHSGEEVTNTFEVDPWSSSDDEEDDAARAAAAAAAAEAWALRRFGPLNRYPFIDEG